MAGSTCIEHVFMEQYEPTIGTELEISTNRNKNFPLFRKSLYTHSLLDEPMRNVSESLKYVAESLKIPPSLYTSRSYRSGYAKGIVEGVVSRGDPQRIVTFQGVRESLHTSSLWKSYQADVYLRNTFNSLLSQSTSQVGISAADWQAAVFNCSADNKTGYTNIDINNLEGFLISKSKNEQEMKSKYDRMTKSEKLVLCETINYGRWKHCDTVASTPESRRAWLLNQPQLDAKTTFQRLANFLKAKYPMFLPFNGYGRCQSGEPYICPVVNCKNASFSSVAASSDHWIQEHAGNESSLRFICVVCESVVENGFQSLRSFKRHLNNHSSSRSTLNEVFNWCFVDEDMSSENV
ncbi:hypothetical protein L3Y34_016782 [Caenorhabditis briggsae]|uniref:Uncharacterized protein n=1 Tax=Caenorhabditis briggsae TaxID=6238 RepID=A0AAE9DY83_CAEBR|nr:hypothetical protein L3Y34_016781 [Caenorhabditis briggsae]ULU14541.1 hypothetical protein L3Y34_016782 [Caenorhabditis briggsae]